MIKIIYKLFYIPFWLFALLPLRILYLKSDFLYFLIYYIIRYRKKVVYKNLKNSFPEKSEKEITIIAKKFYRHLCDLFIESVKIIHLSKEQLDKRVNYTNVEILKDLFERKKDIVLVSGHYGNWEWMVNLQLQLLHRLLIIYRPLNNKFANELVFNIRIKFGITMVPMKEIFREAIRYKQKKELITVYFLADQRPPRRNKFWTTFLNQDTPFFTGFEIMAKKFNMAVIYLNIQKVGRGYYDVKFEKLYEDTKDVPNLEITKKVVKTIEDSIIKNPEYWLWSHKRWKHKRENIE